MQVRNCRHHRLRSRRSHGLHLRGQGQPEAAVYRGFQRGRAHPRRTAHDSQPMWKNYPGFPEKVTGHELSSGFATKPSRQGTEIVTADVTKVDLSGAALSRSGRRRGRADAHQSVIIATGARANYWAFSEDKLRTKESPLRGVRGALFRGEPVPSSAARQPAMEEAMYPVGLCGTVTLIQRRDEFRASKAMLTGAVLANRRSPFFGATRSRGEGTWVRTRSPRSMSRT